MSTNGIMSGTDGAASANPLLPTFQGYIMSTMDALILFESCLTGRLFHVPRRPHDRERSNLIVSGNVFIYEEHSSGIKRWTDGVPWSPSRILGNFLLYRELDKPFQPGEKKRAMKRNKPETGITKPTNNSRANSVSGVSGAMISTSAPLTNFDNTTNCRNDAERALVGSLIDSYQFKQDGLVKKTISVTYQGIQHHLVSYYSLDDVINSRLKTPGQDPALSEVVPRPSLISSGSFRAPVDDHEILMTEPHFKGYIDYSHPYGTYNMNGAGIRSMSMPTIQGYTQPTWSTSAPYTGSYGLNQGLPPPTNFTPVSTPSYSYDSSNMTTSSMVPTSMPLYGITPRSSSSVGPTSHLSTQRHSSMHGSNGVSGVDYSGLPSLDASVMSSSRLITSGEGNLGGHDLSNQSSYSNGAMFGSSAAASAAAPTAAPISNHHHDPYDHSGSSQQSDIYNSGNSGQHSGGFDTQLDHHLDTGSTHQSSVDFNPSLSDLPSYNLPMPE
ncbi:Gti1/Pac2 family-domain-containing protein [Hypoxylon trugodes]|uniref:Gti1/Pac2 family-domain-containing protein n=1 Tax=Hypoxylon trugodes TaxID=326681 RepID=UPI00218D99A7|nr:Gti1/Pac2 family-domain-containing protein [Hypoxylon trugodes]KAI1384500.1 Gti1/Pac2 family-domain-containing protein [Hypoxylon trugodes]